MVRFARWLAVLVLGLFGLGSTACSSSPREDLGAASEALGVSYVQGNSASPQTSLRSLTVPFPAAQAAGNLDVVIVSFYDDTSSVASVADMRGNVYRTATGAGAICTTGHSTIGIYYAANIAAGANGVTVTFNASVPYPEVMIAEYQGADPISPFDVGSAAAGTSATSNSGSATLSSANELIVAANYVENGTVGPGPSFTKRFITSPDSDILEDRMAPTSGSYNATASLNASGWWVSAMAAFRSATGVDAGTTDSGKADAGLDASVEASRDAGADADAGADTGAEAGNDAGSSSGVAFPLRISPNKQYLVDQNGVPFFWQGDSAWELIQNLSHTDAATYFTTRKQQGFNAVVLELIEHLFTPQSHSPHWVDANGNPPFTAFVSGATCPNPTGHCPDFTTPNEAYFANVDWVVQQAQAQGFVVLLAPAYLGCVSGRDNGTHLQGWLEEMKANGPANLTTYGRFLGQRYRSYPNIVWVEGGDYTPSTIGSPSEMDLVNALANGIIAGEGGGSGVHLQTAHFGGGPGGEPSDLSPAWLSVDSTYTGLGTGLYTEAQRQEARDTGLRPLFLIESGYENEKGYTSGALNSSLVLRAQMYQPVLSGEMGFDFGSDPVWFLGHTGDGNAAYGYDWPVVTTGIWSSWSASLGSPGATWASLAGRFFRSIAWQSLVPDVSGLTLTSGNGTGGAILARSADGTLAVAYLTASASVTVNMGRLAGTTTARWFDPSSGTYRAVAGSPLVNSGTYTFTPPSQNAGGDPDWVLLLQAP
jgi:hypothetical protein